MELGKIFEKAKRNSDALTEYQAVVRLDPDNPDGYFLLARLYDRLGNREKSLETLNAGVKATNHPKLRKIRDQLQAKTAAASQ